MNRDREREREGRRRWHRIRLTCSRDRLAGAPSHLPRHTRAACVFFFERPIPADKNFLDAKSAFSKCGRRFITGLSPQGGVESSFFPLSLSLSLFLSLLVIIPRTCLVSQVPRRGRYQCPETRLTHGEENRRARRSKNAEFVLTRSPRRTRKSKADYDKVAPRPIAVATTLSPPAVSSRGRTNRSTVAAR